MNTPITKELLDALRSLDACTLANAIESFGARLRNTGFADGSIRCLFPSLPPMVGHAVTLKLRGSSPPVGQQAYRGSTDWWEYVLSVPAPRVVVVEDVSSRPGLGALLGEVHVNILLNLGCVGAVTNGAVRDLPAVERLKFPFFAGCLSVSHSYVHVVGAGQPVVVGGLAIESGDLVHGDLHGIQTIPPGIAAGLPAAAARITARERDLIALCRSPAFTLERLRKAVEAPRP
jgi:regulator of RNase E activity RraA